MAAGNDKYTQDGRILKLTTPLGKDFLVIESIVGHEAISKLFLFRIDALHAETSETAPPKVIKPSEILGMGISVELVQPDGTKRLFHGMVNRLSQGGRDADFTSYQIEVVPQLWLLTKSRQSRIFQQMSVPDILRKVFNGFNFKMQVQRQYQPRNYCVQYRESDFDFASRIMEEEGIFYFFEHTSDSHTLVIADKQDGHLACPFKNSVDFAAENTEELQTPVVYDWRLDYEIQPGKFQFWDNNFQLPNKNLEASWNSRYTDVGNKKVEVYEYPGTFAKKFDGIDKGGGEQTSKLQKVFEDNCQVAESTADVFDAKFRTYRGGSDCSSFTAGHKFKIAHLPIKEDDREYVLTSVQFNYHQSPSYRPTVGTRRSILNRFECIPVGDGKFPTFRPQQTTPKPTVYGSQTAYVVGPPGEEIYTDKYGRVKVQFHWDRDGKMDPGSSCWCRVSQSWAGKQWGAMFIPRIGMEVIVQFLEGDPDQPIITGCVYNPESMPPYTLPDNKTRMTIKSNSSKGGNGFNEIRFEDKKGSEQIFIHAEKNEDIRVKNECHESIGSSRSLTVGGSQMESVGGDKHLNVKGDQNEKIGGTLGLNVGGNVFVKAGQGIASQAGTQYHIKSGVDVTIDAPVINLKGSGGFIQIGPTGVTIQGAMVLINSGGAASSATSVSPTGPTAPTESDDDNSGKKVEPAKPPSPPQKQGPAAGAMSGAAASGAPVVQQQSGGGSGGNAPGGGSGGGGGAAGAPPSGGAAAGAPGDGGGAAGVPPSGGGSTTTSNPDGSTTTSNPDGSTTTTNPDGTTTTTSPSGERTGGGDSPETQTGESGANPPDGGSGDSSSENKDEDNKPGFWDDDEGGSEKKDDGGFWGNDDDPSEYKEDDGGGPVTG